MVKKQKYNCIICKELFESKWGSYKFCSKKCVKKQQMIDFQNKKTSKNINYLTLRFSVLKRDDFQCKYCGRSAYENGVKLHVDHLFPRSRGGEDNKSNLITSCLECNLGKGDILLEKRQMEKIKNSIKLL